MTAVSSGRRARVSTSERLSLHHLAQGARPRDGARGSGIARRNHQMWTTSLIAPRTRHGCHRQFGRAFESDERARPAVAQVIGNLAGLEEHVQRDDDGARFQDSEVGDRKPGHVGTGKGHVLARANAHRRQPTRYLRGTGRNLCVGVMGFTARDRHPVGRDPRLMFEDARKVQRSGVRRHGKITYLGSSLGVHGVSHRSHRFFERRIMRSHAELLANEGGQVLLAERGDT